LKNTSLRKIFVSITVGIVATVIGGLILSFIQGINFINGLKNLFDAFIFVLTFKISIYVILILSFFIILFFYYRKKVLLKQNEILKESIPPFLNYRRDIFKEWIWTWDYFISQHEKAYKVIKLIPLCPKCECMLKFSFSGNVRCPNCNYIHFGENEEQEDIEKIIYQRINKHYDKPVKTTNN
jgi:hypothetical protein